MENLFSRLIKYRPREDIIPRENFITELFCGMLKKVPALKEIVLKYIFKKLNIDQLTVDLDWEISTQFYLGKHGTADFAFKNNNKILLVEHKVDSSAKVGQIESYHEYLDNLNSDGVGLILLTKEHSLDYKNNNKYKPPFRVIFWHEIVDEMENFIKENKLKEPELSYLKDFYDFLIAEGMRMKRTFEPIDFITIQNARSVFQLMDNILNGSAKEKLNKLIQPGKLSEGTTPLTQLKDHGRYIYWGSIEYFEILMGFFVEQNEETFKAFFDEDISQRGYPIAYISIEVNPKAKDKNIISLCEDFAAKNGEWRIFNNNSRRWWDVLICSKSLRDLKGNDHIKEINDWWEERLEELDDFLIKIK